jgi:hypothetical protein
MWLKVRCSSSPIQAYYSTEAKDVCSGGSRNGTWSGRFLSAMKEICMR